MEVQPEAFAAAPGRVFARADLVGVGIDDDVGRAHLTRHQEPHRLVRAVHDLMRSTFARRQGDDLALLQLSPAVRGTQVRASPKDDEQLLVA